MNPVGSKDQRDKVRASLDDSRWLSTVEADILLALDGLDIAEEMAGYLAGLHPITDDGCVIDEALAAWDKWRGEAK